YFSLANQRTAALALWIGTMYLLVKRENFVISLIPALFITDMAIVYILYDCNLGFGLSYSVSHIGGILATICIPILFFWKCRMNLRDHLQVDFIDDVKKDVA